MKIGILGLQGNVHSHIKILQKIDIEPVIIRYPDELDKVSGLIIPGGESTTMTNLMERMGFVQPILKFAESYPILGTCAGLILLAKEVNDMRVKPLGLLDVSISRNGYGRQVYSFSDTIEVTTNEGLKDLNATFIRAPKINQLSKTTKILSKYDNEPIAVQEGKHIGLTFHPELNGETYFHELMIGPQKT